MVDSNAARQTYAPLVEVFPADDIGLSAYDRFCQDARFAPPQHPLWIRAWVEASGSDAVIIMLRKGGAPVFALALEVVREGPFAIAQFPSAEHANGNFPAVVPDAGLVEEADIKAICSAVQASRPDIDLISLQRQNPNHGNLENPLRKLAAMRSPNVSLAVDLRDGLEAALKRNGGRRKKKKFRHNQRKFDEIGGYRVIKASSPEEVDRLLDAFFMMKAARFAERGIPNVFAPLEVQTFFRRLYSSSLVYGDRPFEVKGIEINGELVAVHGMSINEHSVVCDFGGIVEMGANLSPGFFFDYLCIEEACNAGKSLYDFSVGDEPYKRSWCDVETWQFDTLLPLTAKGRAAWAITTARGHAVRLIKSNAVLWSVLKQSRTKVAGTRSTPHDQ